MALNLYRRHNQNCEGGHPRWSTSGQHEERSKKWKRCGCPILASGSLAKQFKRLRTGRITWEDALSVADRWEAAGSWAAVVEPTPAPTTSAQNTVGNGTTIERAISAYMAEHRKNSASQTVKRYGYLMAKIRTYAEHKGYTTIGQWMVSDVREFRDSWNVSVPTANRDMSVIRAFFEFCVDNEWLEKNPAKKVKNPKGRSAGDGRAEQKLPFTDKELELMYTVAETKYGKTEIKWDKTTHHHTAAGVANSWRYTVTGKDLADFISVSVYTGLRISDVATFHIDRLKPNGEVAIRTTKGGTTVNTWIPDWLQKVIRRRSLEVGPLIFGEHQTKDLNVVTDVWRRKLKRLWTLCGTWKDKPTPHRFRHSFARILLERPGVTVRDVAELLGNSEQMVLRHYAAWIPSRQERLTELLKSAFAETPRPDNVVQMPIAVSK
jgi:site-specific recombinase XerD